MAELLGPTGGTRDAAPKISCASQAGDLREEVGGGPAMGWTPDLQEEILDAEKPEARRHGGREHQEAFLAVLPGEDWELPYRAIPPMGEEPAHGSVLVVTVQGSQ